MPNPVLIGLAHGSRHPATRGAVEAVMARASELLDGVPARSAFLDLTEPTLETVCCELAEQGFTRAIVVPLLFTRAFHARVDTPQAMAAAAQASGLNLVRAEILGMDASIAAGVLQRAVEAGLGESDSLSIYAVGSSSERANDEVRELAAAIALNRPQAPTTASFATSAEPRGRDVAAKHTAADRLVFAPLFLAPGTLLDTLHTAHPEPALARIGAPLGVLAAPAVARRYQSALAKESNRGNTAPLDP